jgi:GNAT superfamily N-acetyltransferase
VNDTLDYKLNPPLDNEALNVLYDAAWPAHTLDYDWTKELSHALATIWAYDGERLVGYVRVAWDGGIHAFLLEPTVHPEYQHRGIGTELVRRANDAARAAGCETMHVDYEARLAPFYEACGFRHTEAGLISLRS